MVGILRQTARRRVLAVIPAEAGIVGSWDVATHPSPTTPAYAGVTSLFSDKLHLLQKSNIMHLLL
jgi:hypothetical protein